MLPKRKPAASVRLCGRAVAANHQKPPKPFHRHSSVSDHITDNPRDAGRKIGYSELYHNQRPAGFGGIRVRLAWNSLLFLCLMRDNAQQKPNSDLCLGSTRQLVREMRGTPEKLDFELRNHLVSKNIWSIPINLHQLPEWAFRFMSSLSVLSLPLVLYLRSLDIAPYHVAHAMTLRRRMTA